MAEAPTYRSLQPQLPSPIAPSAAHASPPPAGSFHPPQAVHVPPPMAYYPPPSQGIAAPGVMGRWSTGLCDCFEDAELCCVTCWCPCITFGQIAEIVDRGSTSCGLSGALYGIILGVSFSLGIPGIQFIYSCSYRSKMRAQYNLPEEPCMDCCVHCCCECCALCQEYRELRNHGYDMNIGWHENMRRLQAADTVATPPPMHGDMIR